MARIRALEPQVVPLPGRRHPRLARVAEVASWLWTPRPLRIRPALGLAAAALLVFAATFGEYTLSAFLVGDLWQTSGVWLYKMWDQNPHETMAIGIVSFTVSWACSFALLYLFGRRGAHERIGA